MCSGCANSLPARACPLPSSTASFARLVADYRPVRIAVDQTGMGEAVVEQLQAVHGRYRVEGVILSAPKRLDVATALREALEDGRLRIPTNEPLRHDLHSMKAEASVTGAPRLVAQRAGTDGHADRFWALALACAAASTPVEHFAYEPVSPYDDADDDFYGNRYSIKAQRGFIVNPGSKLPGPKGPTHRQRGAVG